MEMNQYPAKIAVQTVTILNGATESNALVLFGTAPVVVELPAAITGTNLSFKGSIDGGVTYCPIKNASATISYTAAASGSYPLDPDIFIGYDAIKVVMDAQGADRIIKIKPYAI